MPVRRLRLLVHQGRDRSHAEGVDILVNNAGNGGAGEGGNSAVLGKFEQTEPDDWDRYFAVNLYGVLHCTRVVLPHMVANAGGRVITIISDAGRVGEAFMAPYAAAKAGAAGFTPRTGTRGR